VSHLIQTDPRADESPGIRAVPQAQADRDRLRCVAAELARRLEPSRPPRHGDLERLGTDVLRRVGLETRYLGFAMVALDNAFWTERFAGVPFHRRLLLLPHCLHEPDRCQGDYDRRGLECKSCGACVIDDLKRRAESLGYHVLVAEGTPAVVQVVLDGRADAILGVACMESLEKAFRRISDLGIPHATVPLLTNGCDRTTVEVELLRELIDRFQPGGGSDVASYVPLLRAASQLCEDGSFRSLLDGVVRPEVWEPRAAGDPMSDTERIALEWLRKGGKRFRPFITLAGYAAGALEDRRRLVVGRKLDGEIPIAVRRVALAIEALHKASLAHDDIQDNDAYRYGGETLHRRYGIDQAINLGDYLIGLGYRLVAAQRDAIGPEVAAAILTDLSEAHQKLCRGQGAELILRRQRRRQADPLDPMAVHALKTAPAFHVALTAGIRMAGRHDFDPKALASYCRWMGVAYQTLNDLKDWQADDHDKLLAGQDALAMRPTVLEAFARQAGADPPSRADGESPRQWVARLRQAYRAAGVFEQAAELIDGCRRRALGLAERTRPASLGRLMEFVARTVLG